MLLHVRLTLALSVLALSDEVSHIIIAGVSRDYTDCGLCIFRSNIFGLVDTFRVGRVSLT